MDNNTFFAYLQLTRNCNQECIICSYPAFDKTTSLKEAKKQMRQFKKEGATGIIFTGGEPTLHEGLTEAIKFCIFEGMEPLMITNGQRLADEKYAEQLGLSGIKIIHISVYSYKKEVHEKITQTPGSWQNMQQGIQNAIKYVGAVNINIVITALNYDHISDTVRFLCLNAPQIRHFVFNYIIVTGNVTKNLSLVPKFIDTEKEIRKTAMLLKRYNKTFRLEHVPLCYMHGFEECSTETRQIVKNKPHIGYILRKSSIEQKNMRGTDMHKHYVYGEDCKYCFLSNICAGVDPKYAKYHGTKELYPIFKNPKKIISKITGRNS